MKSMSGERAVQCFVGSKIRHRQFTVNTPSHVPRSEVPSACPCDPISQFRYRLSRAIRRYLGNARARTEGPMRVQREVTPTRMRAPRLLVPPTFRGRPTGTSEPPEKEAENVSECSKVVCARVSCVCLKRPDLAGCGYRNSRDG